MPRISGVCVTAVPSGAQDQESETQTQVTQGESEPDDDQAEAAHAPDTEEDTSSDDGVTDARGPAVARRVPDSPLHKFSEKGSNSQISQLRSRQNFYQGMAHTL